MVEGVGRITGEVSATVLGRMFEDQRTIALIAGNILTGRMPFGGGGKEADVKAVAWAVGLARLIVHEVDATEPLPTRTR